MKTSLLTFFMLFLIGCKDQQKSIQEKNKTRIDTLTENKIGSKTAPIILENEKAIVNYDTDFSDWKIDEIDLTPYSFLNRKNDTLILTARDTIILLVNEYYDEFKENYGASSFSVAHVYPHYNIVELQATAYEYSYHILADLHTGDTIFSYGQPMFSNNGKYIFTSNVDLEIGYDDNGYQLITVDSLGFNTLKTVTLEGWGIQKASWISADSIAFSKVTLNENYELNSENKKMKLK